ncbi:peptidyl-prolyl cis-trans isomerase [Bacillus sp. T33-2]|uniref:peptidyl-prolyl cis-trans isomerase n=1 Tax=Bacillus sp. T33-2 TaxID=2054168 RepID=UPI000C76A0B9|nr:peptidyl-prolyl cis-trans isomerase [Bacillus sp. T33-2]PLR91887.1 peptidylprolyl isomerase [Bacillus sp. T33-2]
MEKKHLWLVIAGLVALNCLTAVYFLAGPGKAVSSGLFGNGELVAEVGGQNISRQEWLMELEERYGEETLKDLIDQRVTEQMAEKYDIKVSEKAVELELAWLKTMYNSLEDGSQGEREWRQQIKHNLLLEELLTKDAAVSEEEMKQYYEQNKSMFNIPDAYHLSQIVVKTKKEADQTIKELEQGSSFAALAMERSIDEFSANKGGDLGYVTWEDDRFPPEIIEEAQTLKRKKWTDPIKLESGYAILFLHEKLNGKEYKFKEVKDQIRRQIALEQMGVPVSAQPFWAETGVDWFYGSKEEK